MTKFFTASVLTAAAVLFLAAPADAASLAARQRNQVQRTRQGIGQGQINRNEARNLAAQQRSIHQQIVRDRIDGPGFTAAERARADRALDRQSGRIYRARHNGR